jgi:hypothetical protein
VSVKLRARGSDGKVAIYRGPDDAPFTNPLGNLPRVLFHSDLHYPTIIGQVSGSIRCRPGILDGRRCLGACDDRRHDRL